MSGDMAIRVQGLHCRLGGRPVLADLSFEVAAGEFLSIIGPNGAGKSTLVKCLDGILRDWEGSIEMAGLDVRSCAPRELARRTAYVPQLRGGSPSFRVAEFLMLSRYARRGPFSAPGRADLEAVNRALELTHTESLRERSLDTLSGGENQKVQIAAALAQDTPILLLDEPITFLDPRYQHEVNSLLKRLNREQGMTVVCVSHDINSAVLSSHRVLGLKAGQQVFLDAVDALMRPAQLTAIFDTEFLFVAHPESGQPLVVPRH
jgi:ABC-type cobalamin/Fe3+-siderophores transport system ATPase subunit